MQFTKGDKVIIIKNTKVESGIITFVKDFDMKRKFNKVQLEDGSIEDFTNEELIKEEI